MSQDSQSVMRALSRLPQDVPGVVSVLEALQVIAELRAPRLEEDGLACFNYLYREITREVRKRIDNDEFEDADFIIRLDVEFAKRYFEAILADAVGTQVPASWSVLLDRRSAPNIEPVQFAVAGVNAHVDYDLAFALISTCRALDRPLGESERADYEAINQVFADHMGQLRQHFETRSQRRLDAGVFAQLADGVGDLAVVLSRDAAWHRAEHLNTMSDPSPELERARAAIDWRTAMVGRAVLDLP
jgi:hypothetical protein